MIHPETGLRFAKNSAEMRQKVRAEFGDMCLMTGTRYESQKYKHANRLECAHVLPASTFPEFAACLENGVQLVAYRHNWRFGYPEGEEIGCLDLLPGKSGLESTRGVTDRFRWMRDNFPERSWEIVQPRFVLLITEGAKFSQGVRSRQEKIMGILES